MKKENVVKQVKIFIAVIFSLAVLGGGMMYMPFPQKGISNTPLTSAKSASPEYAKWQYWDSTRHVADYDLACRQVMDMQAELAKKYAEAEDVVEKKKILKEAQDAIFEGITQTILPYWNETEWDFNGTTHLPTQGVIACGYFVATILQHAGIELERIKMGQASSTNLVKALCEKSSIQTFQNKDFEGFWKHLQKTPDGLYIIGLDKHAGLIAKKEGKITFIHSRMPRLAGVIFENAQKSLTLQRSKVHVIGNVLANNDLVKKWLGE
jgi:hypothetical protein